MRIPDLIEVLQQIDANEGDINFQSLSISFPNSEPDAHYFKELYIVDENGRVGRASFMIKKYKDKPEKTLPK